MQIQPYLFFNGRCEEALNFYREVLGAEIEALMRFKEAPQQETVPPGAADKVMHASVKIGDSHLMASDGLNDPTQKISGFSLSIGVPGVDEGRRLCQALAAGGKIDMAFAPTFWTSGFGMLTDKFGVAWMVSVDH